MSKSELFLDLTSGVAPGEERGERPVMVEANANCTDCNTVHDIEKCPKCGAWIELGFGLMFGGFGPYKFCTSKTCDWFWKMEAEE
jgi:hypothetical protein